MIKAVIFDMDGVMIDSELVQSKAFEAVIKEYGKVPVYNESGVVHTIGIRSRENWEVIKKKHSIEEETDILIEKRRAIYGQLLETEIKPMPGLLELLALLKKHKVKIALASSSNLKHIDLVLSRLNIRDYFEVIVSGDMVQKGKPFPDVFEETARRLRVLPAKCLVLEDTESGVNAAKDAGMNVIVIPNRFTQNQDFSNADLVINTLQRLAWSILSRC